MTLQELGWSPFFHAALSGGEQAGRVSNASRGHYRLLCADGERDAAAAGQLLYQALSSADLPVVGDWVTYQGTDVVRIERVLPRQSRISRKAPGTRTEEQVLAANVDTCFLVSGLDEDFNPRRIERYVLMTQQSGAEAVIVLNKSDLAPDIGAVINDVVRVAPDTPIVPVSALQSGHLNGLSRFLLPGRTVAFLGSSGVGKSTLINRLAGRNRQRTAAVRESDHRGRHTTTQRELIRLESGALLIDMPGLRELQPWLPGDSLEQTFDDIAELAGGCRFRDCRHQGEPGCAVARAIEEGDLGVDRANSFSKLRREAEYLERKVDQRAALAEKQRWKQIHKAIRHMDKRR